MKLRFTPAENQALLNLRPNPEWGIVLNAIANHAEQVMRQHIFAKADKEVIQGHAQAYTILLEAIGEAHQNYEQSQQPKT